MQREALRLGAFLWASTVCLRVFAHGVPPDAYAVVSHDAAGLRAVSLSAGLALRRSAQRFQFVCPAAWGDQFAAPLAALADGTIVVGASSGLMLLAEDGTLRAHPDPAAVGRSSDVVRSAHGVFSLRSTNEGREVLVIDAQTVRVLWKDTSGLYSLAALDDKLVLQGVSGRMLEQVTIAAASGAELDRQRVVLDLPADNVFARADAGAAYALVVLRSGAVTLGSLRMNTFSMLAKGELSIAGPLSIESGTLLALDGKLSRLVDGQLTPLADDHKVVCLAQHDGLSYACERDGISRVSGQALGEPLFRFSWLSAPDLARVPEGEARMRCNMQWQDLRTDLALIDTSLLEDTVPGANAQPGSALAGRGVDAQDAGVAAVVPKASRGCATLPGGHTPGAADTCALGLVLALALVRYRRGRRMQARRDRISGISSQRASRLTQKWNGWKVRRRGSAQNIRGGVRFVNALVVLK